MSIFHRILVPIDGSEPSNAAVALALKFAQTDGSAPELVFCHVVDVAAEYRAISEAQMILGAQDMIDEDRARGEKLVEAVLKQRKTPAYKPAAKYWTAIRRRRSYGVPVKAVST